MIPEAIAAEAQPLPLPEAAVAFLAAFNEWAHTLTIDEFKEIAPILQTLRAAHVRTVTKEQ
jgi:hypothetical protein